MSSKSGVISFFIPSLAGGGAQKVIVNLVNSMVDLTDRPIHLVLGRAQGEFLSEVRSEVVIVDLGTARASRSIFALVKYLRKQKPSVLCSSLNYANVCATLAWFLAGSASRLVLREDSVVRVPEGNLAQRVRDHVTQLLMRVLYRRADLVVALGEGVAATLRDRRICKAENIEIIGNPVAIKMDSVGLRGKVIAHHSWKGKYIVGVGRLSPEKGFDVLIEAFSKIENVDCDLVVLGNGGLRTSLMAQAERVGVADRVHLPGFLKNPHPIMAHAQLFVLPSRWEGFGLVVVEAMALGVPVVATDCPGAPNELLLNGKLGHLVPPGDPDALAAAITDAMASPRATVGLRMERAAEFASPVIAKQYFERAFRLESAKVNENSSHRYGA